MSVNLESVLKNIQSEKNTKLTANNLRYGVNCMGVQGGLHPVTIEGGDVGRAIYLQDTTPEDPNGIWVNTDKTCDDIYLENERYATDGSIVFSNADTTDPSNPIANHTNNHQNLLGVTYAQKGNVVHIFGYYNTTASSNTTGVVHRHWKYDFDTDTWTQLSDCPTPQGGVSAVWVGDYIYIFGTAYNVNTDYARYSYKYNTVNDTWERLSDIPITFSTLTSNGIGCAYDNDDTIYMMSGKQLYKYIISTGTYRALLTIPSSGHVLSNLNAGYNRLSYYNNKLYTIGITIGSTSSYHTGVYNISSNTWTNTTAPGNYIGTNTPNSVEYTSGQILCGNKLYGFGSTDNYILYSGMTASNKYYGWLNLDTPTQYKKISTSNPFSAARNVDHCPICRFTTDRGDVIVFLAGISSGINVNVNNQIGVIIQDKDYSDLENNTLIVYTTNGSMGTYITALYQDDKVINGKIYQRFNDVNFWDAENQTLIKNLRTYYGNGTEWVQIK